MFAKRLSLFGFYETGEYVKFRERIALLLVDLKRFSEDVLYLLHFQFQTCLRIINSFKKYRFSRDDKLFVVLHATKSGWNF